MMIAKPRFLSSVGAEQGAKMRRDLHQQCPDQRRQQPAREQRRPSRVGRNRNLAHIETQFGSPRLKWAEVLVPHLVENNGGAGCVTPRTKIVKQYCDSLQRPDVRPSRTGRDQQQVQVPGTVYLYLSLRWLSRPNQVT
jgi:hypothetical protein